MSKYVDADKLLKLLPDDLPYKASVKRVLMQAPDADVVPIAEVDELIGKLEFLLCHATGGRLSKHTYDLRTMETVVTDCVNETYNDGFAEGAREIFAELEAEIEAALKSNYKALDMIYYDAELYQRVQGKIDALRGIEGFLEELRKKHTEVEK